MSDEGRESDESKVWSMAPGLLLGVLLSVVGTLELLAHDRIIGVFMCGAGAISAIGAINVPGRPAPAKALRHGWRHHRWLLLFTVVGTALAIQIAFFPIGPADWLTRGGTAAMLLAVSIAAPLWVFHIRVHADAAEARSADHPAEF